MIVFFEYITTAKIKYNHSLEQAGVGYNWINFCVRDFINHVPPINFTILIFIFKHLMK